MHRCCLHEQRNTAAVERWHYAESVSPSDDKQKRNESTHRGQQWVTYLKRPNKNSTLYKQGWFTETGLFCAKHMTDKNTIIWSL